MTGESHDHDGKDWEDDGKEDEKAWADFCIPLWIGDAQVQQGERVEVWIDCG